MNNLHFPEPYKHLHSPVKELDELLPKRQSLGKKVADRVTMIVGSWQFLILQSLLLVGWFVVNSIRGVPHWDPYPFIFMNLILSLQAAYTASVVMISENREAERDRLQAKLDYEINLKAEEEVRAILEHLASQDEALRTIHERILNIQEILDTRTAS